MAKFCFMPKLPCPSPPKDSLRSALPNHTVTLRNLCKFILLMYHKLQAVCAIKNLLRYKL